MSVLGLIAGKGLYPSLLLEQARKAGVARIAVAAFEGETGNEVVAAGYSHCWMRVGQLGKLMRFFREQGVDRAIMAGQITPGRLFDLRPDLKALILIARLKERNAESLFGAVAVALKEAGVELLPATTYLDEFLAGAGLVAGPKPSKSHLRDIQFGWPITREIARLNIGQSVVVKKGTVLAVEGYDGTNATIRRGGGIGGGDSVLIKVPNPGQDMRFDVPVIGPDTVRIAVESGVSCVAVEAKKTLLLGADELRQLASLHQITIWAQES